MSLRDLLDDGTGHGLIPDVADLNCDVSELQDRCATAEAEIIRLRDSNNGLLEVITQLMVNAYTDQPEPAPLTWDDPKVVSIAKRIAERHP